MIWEINMKKYDYVIVGSGLFAGVFAKSAIEHNKRCLVVEKRHTLGGNLYCEEIEGIQVHKYGAHIFHTSNRKVWEFVNSLVEFNRFTNSPVANYHGEIFNLPFNMNTFNKMWGVVTPAEAQRIIESQKTTVTETPSNLEEQAISLVGYDIYEKLIKGYTEKQWGKKCCELPSFIIKRIPVRYTYDNNYFNDLYQGVPIGGYNRLIDKLFSGCDIETGVDFNLNREKYRELGDKLLYTGTLDSYYDFVYGDLEYRSLRFETEVLSQENYQGVAVVNYTDSETPFTRSIEHKHFENSKSEKTVITREYPLVGKRDNEPYYPINDSRNQEIYLKYAELAEKETLTLFGGRLAEYKYYDMDKVIEAAFSLAQKEFSGR